jgi:putative membrane protein
MLEPRKPAAFVLDGEERPVEPAPHRPKGRKPRAVTGIVFEPEEPKGDIVALPRHIPPSRAGSAFRWAGLLLSALASLVGLWASLALTGLIEDAFARSAVLGWIALGLTGLAATAALAIIVREIWGLMRLSRIEHIQTAAARAINLDDGPAASQTIAELNRIYAGRPDAAWGLQSLASLRNDIMDPRDRVRLAERFLVEPLDQEAHRIIARSARRVTLLTTVTPAAALDIIFVAALNLRMLREIASLYGGRPSVFATLRLARLVVGHLAVTGGLALSDNLLQHLLGKGLLGRLSARFGEGAVNGILTSRIGLAACDVCRPVPQEQSSKETLGSLLKELVTFNDGEKDDATGQKPQP